MKKLCVVIISLFFGYFVLFTIFGFANYNTKKPNVVVTIPERIVDIQEIRAKMLWKRKIKHINAAIAVERPTKTCPAWKSYKKERALGLLQLTPVFVRACNEIVGYEKYSHIDSNDSTKAAEMFFVYQDYHNPSYDYQHGAYLHNGGENYKKFNKENKKKLAVYWSKFKKHL